MFLGSVTGQVLQHAPCPVFAIRIKGQEVQVRAGARAEALVS